MFERTSATIGDVVEESLRIHPEQWAMRPGRLRGWEYVNKREGWKLSRMSLPFTGSRVLSFDRASLTRSEERAIHKALDALSKLRSDQRRAAALRRHYEKDAEQK